VAPPGPRGPTKPPKASTVSHIPHTAGLTPAQTTRKVKRHQQAITKAAEAATKTPEFKKARKAAKPPSPKEQAKIGREYRRYARRTGGTKLSGISKKEQKTYAAQEKLGLTYRPGPGIGKLGIQRVVGKPSAGIQIVRALTGDQPGAQTPTLSEIGNVAATVGLLGAGRVLRAPKIAEDLAASEQRAAEVTRAVEGEQAARDIQGVSRVRKAAQAVKTRGAMKVRRVKSLGTVEGRAASRARTAASVQRKTVKAARAYTHPAVVAPGVHGRINAAIQGHLAALKEDPVGTLATTGRVLPGMIAFPAAVAYAAGKSAVERNPKPLTDEAKGVAAFTKDIGGKLLSGDPQKVKRTVEHDVGLSFVVPIPKLLGGARGTALRAATREKLASATEALPAKRVGPEGRFGFQVSPEKPRAIRRRSAVEGRRVHRRAEHETAYYSNKAVKHARKLTKKKANLPREGEVGPEHAAHAVVKYGVTSHEHIKALKKASNPHEPIEGHVRLSQAIDYLDKHPETLVHPDFQKLTDYLRKAGKATETSERAKWMGIGDLYGRQRPEDMVPVSAHELTAARTREAAWKDVHDRERTIKQLRRNARDARARGDQDASKAAYKRAREVQAGSQALKKALDPYTRPGGSIDIARTKRKPWDNQMVKAYVADVKQVAAERGHAEPVHLPAAGSVISHYKAGEVSARFATGAPAQHTAALDELKADHIDNTLSSVIASGIDRPRRIRAWATSMQQALLREGRPNPEGGNLWTLQSYQDAVRKGEVNPNFYGLMPSRDWKQAAENAFAHEEVQGTKFDELTQVAQDIEQRRQDITGEYARRADEPGTKYVLVHREYMRELDSTLSKPGQIESFLNANSKLWNRVLLGLSPGWELSQFVAEGLPILIAHPEIIYKAPKYIREYNRMTKDDARAWAGLAGEAPRLVESARDLRPDLPENTMADVGRLVKLTERNRALQGMWSVARARPLGLFDMARTGKYRQVLAMAELDRDLNTFMRGFRGSMHFSKETAARIKNLPLHEQMAWLGKHPSEAVKLENYIDDIAGNWDAFTSFERSFSPALIFFPFIRYSLRWTFWSFPMRHPVRAQILYFLSQMNADSLEKLLGAKPHTWTDYAFPVVNRGGAVEPYGTRISPALSTPVEAVGSGNVTRLMGAANPSLALLVEAITGVNPMTGEQEAKGAAALHQLLAMPAPLRALSRTQLGPVKVPNITGASTSPTAQAFRNIDPNRNLRSLLAPPLPLSAERYRMQNALSANLDASSTIDSEVGQFAALVDQYGMKEASKRFKADIKAGKVLSGISGGSADAKFQRIQDRFYEIKYGTGGGGGVKAPSNPLFGGSAGKSVFGPSRGKGIFGPSKGKSIFK
jgi:hypothetical protein